MLARISKLIHYSPKIAKFPMSSVVEQMLIIGVAVTTPNDLDSKIKKLVIPTLGFQLLLSSWLGKETRALGNCKPFVWLNGTVGLGTGVALAILNSLYEDDKSLCEDDKGLKGLTPKLMFFASGFMMPTVTRLLSKVTGRFPLLGRFGLLTGTLGALGLHFLGSKAQEHKKEVRILSVANFLIELAKMNFIAYAIHSTGLSRRVASNIMALGLAFSLQLTSKSTKQKDNKSGSESGSESGSVTGTVTGTGSGSGSGQD